MSEDREVEMSFAIPKAVNLPPVNEEELNVPLTKMGKHIKKLRQPIQEDRDDINGFHVEFNVCIT